MFFLEEVEMDDWCASNQGRRRAGKWRGQCPPCRFKRGETGAEEPLHKNIIGSFMVYQYRIEKKYIAAIRAPRRFRRAFCNICYYFWGQHYCETETSINGNDFFKFPLSSTVLLPCPTAAPASLLPTTLHVIAIIPVRATNSSLPHYCLAVRWPGRCIGDLVRVAYVSASRVESEMQPTARNACGRNKCCRLSKSRSQSWSHSAWEPMHRFHGPGKFEVWY